MLMTCTHEATARYPLLEPDAASNPTQYEALEWCHDCGATRILAFELLGEDRSPELQGATVWEPPRKPQIAAMQCSESPSGEHLWRDHGEHVPCVVYRCELCDRKGLGEPMNPDGARVPATLRLEVPG